MLTFHPNPNPNPNPNPDPGPKQVLTFHRRGLSCCVSTDDPSPANISLVDEWRRCLAGVGIEP